jgi:nucleotide-binding universal stress UspA family protein
MKITMNPILVATDFTPSSKLAFKTAFDLAGKLGTNLVVVFVQNSSDLRFALQTGIKHNAKNTRDIRKRVRSYLDQNFKKLIPKSASPSFTIRTLVLRGEPWIEIVRLARRIKAQMIVAGTRGRSATLGLVLGSTAQQLIRSAHCPVVVVRAK